VLLEAVLRLSDQGSDVALFDSHIDGLTVGLARGVSGVVAAHGFLSMLISLLFQRADEDAKQLFEALDRIGNGTLTDQLDQKAKATLSWMREAAERARRSQGIARWAFATFHVGLPVVAAAAVMWSARVPVYELILRLINLCVTS
jgi:hypothetical protein